MFPTRLLRTLRARLTSSRKPARRRRPSLEALEGRDVPATFTVTTTADSGDDAHPVAGSLRWAILQANADLAPATSPDAITFDIDAASDAASGGTGYDAGTGVATIKPLSALPAVTASVIIDGYTQGQGTPLAAQHNTLRVGTDAALKVVLDGENALGGYVLAISGAGCTVSGLVINNYQHPFPAQGGAILLSGAGGSVITGNYIGTDVAGHTHVGNPPMLGGITVSSPGNRIGGTDAGDRNVLSTGGYWGVSVQAPNNLILGNYIGTDATGTLAIGNFYGVFVGADSTTVGGAAPGAGNVISASGGQGITVSGSGSTIQGNYIGTDASGTTLVQQPGAPTYAGILLLSTATNNQIGGTVPGAGNVISGNSSGIRQEAAAYNAPLPAASGNRIEGNYIGTDATGTKWVDPAGNPLGNVFGIFGYGINNVIGGTAPGAGNVIAGNLSSGIGIAEGDMVIGNTITHNGGVGIDLRHHGSSVPALISSNTISYNAGGVVVNDWTIYPGFAWDAIRSSVSQTTITGNTIVGNSAYGVQIGDDVTGVSISRNAISDNPQHGGISLPPLYTGTIRGNHGQPAPLLEPAPSGAAITGTLTGPVGQVVRLEFFGNAAPDSSGHYEGQQYLGSADFTLDATGRFSVPINVLNGNLIANFPHVTATATVLSDPRGPDYVGDTSQFSATATDVPVPPPTGVLSGLVYVDFNDDGEVDFGEKAVAGVTVTLTGTDYLGNAVCRSAQTDGQGVYAFTDLPPSGPDGYTLTETQPAGLRDGKDTLGLIDGRPAGTALDDAFVGLVLPAGGYGEDYNFGERPASDGTIVAGQTAAIGFWQNKNGQNLIRSLNGGGTSTRLGDWLAATLPNLYGSLAGNTNAEVAAYFKTLFARTAQTAPGGPPKLDAQVMATSLAVYVTNAALAGTTASAHGFQVTDSGVGTRTFNVGTAGAAFGVANSSEVAVLDLLLAVNARSGRGLLYDLNGDGAIGGTEAGYRTMANDVFAAINEAGRL